MEKKTIEEYPFKWVEKRVKSKKPIRNEKGAMLYKDALVYLVRVLKQDQPDFNLILGLASTNIRLKACRSCFRTRTR